MTIYSYTDIEVTSTAQLVSWAGLEPTHFIAIPYTEEVIDNVKHLRFTTDNAVQPKGGLQDNVCTLKYGVGVETNAGQWAAGKYRLFRSTPYNAMLYDFSNGSRFSPENLHRNWLQLLFLYQEIIEGKVVLSLQQLVDGTVIEFQNAARPTPSAPSTPAPAPVVCPAPESTPEYLALDASYQATVQELSSTRLQVQELQVQILQLQQELEEARADSGTDSSAETDRKLITALYKLVDAQEVLLRLYGDVHVSSEDEPLKAEYLQEIETASEQVRALSAPIEGDPSPPMEM